MKNTRYTETQIIKIMKEVGGGRHVVGKAAGNQSEHEPVTAVLLIDSREMIGLCFLFKQLSESPN